MVSLSDAGVSNIDGTLIVVHRLYPNINLINFVVHSIMKYAFMDNIRYKIFYVWNVYLAIVFVLISSIDSDSLRYIS